MDPSSAYGAIVLMTGRYHDAAYIATQVIQTFQAAFDSRITEIASTRYDGFWVSEDEMSTAVTYMENGSLWINQLLLNGNDVFEVFEGPRYPSHRRYGLWTTGRDEEFRCAPLSPTRRRDFESFYNAGLHLVVPALVTSPSQAVNHSGSPWTVSTLEGLRSTLLYSKETRTSGGFEFLPLMLLFSACRPRSLRSQLILSGLSCCVDGVPFRIGATTGL